MRPICPAIAITLLIPLPVAAWEAEIEGRICVLTHFEETSAVRLTFDPSVPLYTITVTSDDPWPVAGRFGISFYGAQPNIIVTDRHVLSPDMFSISVSDQGFGNVLDGLQFNDTAVAYAGIATMPISLDGAAEPVAAFRACLTTPSV